METFEKDQSRLSSGNHFRLLHGLHLEQARRALIGFDLAAHDDGGGENGPVVSSLFSIKLKSPQNSLGPEGAKRFLARTPNAAGKKTTSCRVGQEAAPDTDFGASTLVG